MSNLEEMVERLHRRGVLDSYANEVAAELVSLYNQFQSAAAAASEYSEFWEKHHGDFDQFGNYVPYSQMDGDLRAAKARLEERTTERDYHMRMADKLAAIINELRPALVEAERFMTYFSGETNSFVGPGTPTKCLTQIRAALAFPPAKAERRCVQAPLEWCTPGVKCCQNEGRAIELHKKNGLATRWDCCPEEYKNQRREEAAATSTVTSKER